MDMYYGTKAISALPMTRQEYNDYRGWELPEDEDGTDIGFLVEYLDGGVSNHPDHVGYVSWSPSEVFEKSYQSTKAMNFGHALEALKTGHRVARTGWNGRGMYLFLATTSEVMQVTAENTCVDTDFEVIRDFVGMRGADGSLVVGWLCSQTDMLANDWQVVG